MGKSFRNTLTLAAFGVLLATSLAHAVDPPTITDFSFTAATQRIAFTANSGGKTCNFAIASSSANTTFDPVQQGGSFGGVSGGTDWGITPGAAAVGEIHKFTITVTNSNGARTSCMLLKVAAANAAGGNVYQFHADCPTVSSWGLAVMVLLMTTAATVILIRRRKAVGLAVMMFAIGISAGNAWADNIPPGLDYFFTPAAVCNPPTAGSYLQLGVTDSPPIPAGFFGPGSQPFSGIICWQGSPLGGSFGLADTVVERLGSLNFDCACGPTCDATVPIEIVALNLISIDPITVNFAGGSSLYNVQANISTAPQIPGSMNVVHECLEGGTFSSNLQVRAKLTFTKVSGANGLDSVVMDPAPASPPNPNFQVAAGVGRWSHTGAQFSVVPGSTFYPGIDWLPCDCDGGTAETAAKTLTHEQAVWAAHGVQVENTNKEHIPTISEWGAAAMALLMLTAATIVMKRRIATA